MLNTIGVLMLCIRCVRIELAGINVSKKLDDEYQSRKKHKKARKKKEKRRKG